MEKSTTNIGRDVLKVLTVVMGRSWRAIIPLTHEVVTSTALKTSRRWSAPLPKLRNGLTNKALSAVAARRIQ